MKYFDNITTAEELKKQFRAYCVSMHPDKGGDPEEFKTMLAEYEEAAKNCGAWTKETREEVQGVRRGLRVVFFGPGMMETYYIITEVQGDNIKMVRIFSHDFRSLEDIDSYLGGEWDDEKSRRELNKYDHIRPLSKKFGIGYYWDDEEQKTYTEQEISEAERIADNFDRWAANWKANKEEEERRAQEESDREEAAIIAQWSSILEQLPEEYKRPEGLSWYDMTNEQREAEKVAERKSSAARLAAFKRNLKAVFNHYWPGVKCSFKISRSIYSSATISWTDGPTVAEVEACEVFNYFLAYYYKSDPYADYGDVHRRTDLHNFRHMFGAFDCEGIDYDRKLSDKTAENVRKVIADNFPEAEKARKEAGEKYNSCYCTFDLSTDDLSKLCALLGFVRPAAPDWETATDEEARAYYAACKPCDDFVQRVRNRKTLSQNDTMRLYYSTLWAYFVEFYRIKAEPQKEKTARKAKAEPETTEQQPNDTASDEAPAEGLQLVEIAEGVAVVGDSRTTYRNRKAIKAHGATWNNEAKQWQATDPEAVAHLRQWFGASATQTTGEADTINENDREKALFVIFAACEIGRLEWHASGYYTYPDATAEDWGTLEAVAPEVVTAWREAGNPINRNECARLYGEELTKEAEDAHTVARNRAKCCEEWRDELREIWAIYKDLTAIESTTTDTDAHAEEQEQEQRTHTTNREQPEPQDQPEQQNAEDVERVTRFAALLTDVFTMFEELATAAQTEAQRAKEAANKQAEADQLRADIARMSAQVAAMSEQLRTMSERLATLEAEANADSHTDSTADTGTASDNEPQQAEERHDNSKNKPETLNMLKAAARHAEQLTEINEHTEALLARLYVLAAVGMRVRSLIERVKAIEAAHGRGYLTIAEASERYEISQEAERKAALYLTPEEFRALYRHDPQTDSRAA